MLKVVAEHNSKIMIVNTSEEITETTKCVVFDTRHNELSDEMPIGCWTARVIGWVEPTKDYSEELSIVKQMLTEE